MALKQYQELIAWQKAIEYAEAVYRLTRKFPRDEVFGLTIQLRRSAVSIASNIAEGQGRGSAKEFIQFLNIAHGSLQESETQMILAHRFGYITEKELDDILALSNELGRINNGLIRAMARRQRS